MTATTVNGLIFYQKLLFSGLTSFPGVRLTDVLPPTLKPTVTLTRNLTTFPSSHPKISGFISETRTFESLSNLFDSFFKIYNVNLEIKLKVSSKFADSTQ